MNPEPLFIQRCEQIVQLLISVKEVELLDLGARLRQLIVDQHSLVGTVNTNKIKIRFGVNPISLPPGLPPPTFYHMEDGLDPETAHPGRTPVLLDLDGFLKHPVSIFQGKEITVKETIKFASNVAGGVHHDPKPIPKEEFATLAAASKHVNIGDYPVGIRQLKAIGRVTMKALEPLIEDVKTRLG